ncbi:MAG: S8 family serine peptidase [Bacteroidales bacterium]|nr:S8 family serine peptidase [Bacteroidales bacterium]
MIRRLLFVATLMLACLGARAQGCYWVYLTDKAGTTFDPYSYFDAKAIERYQLNNANLYDVSNYPLNEAYVSQVDALATEEVGTSRWFNAVAVMATEEQMAAIEALPFVASVRQIASEMQIAAYAAQYSEPASSTVTASTGGEVADAVLTDQLLRMGGQLFKENGIDGTGVRVAIFDGGFPNVDKHQAFKHLRDGNKIIATWDFTKKKENVYYSGTHGTMTLSCITGVVDGKQLGLATGSTFLLAKTEVEPEPYKEEVWWTQAMEWADKNGADVINSSLGYGKDRHYTHEMDGRSHVAKAANMAARKGMLVCNSAGNEGDDDNWKTIITPADADSVITVGGIESSLTQYRHISFSSFGPTADNRMKPNVVNFGHALCADPHNLDETEWAYGTSFSSPLTAGFCACAWQTRRNLTAMQMKKEIEQSCDLYPYFDYAYGYGVPQASYFMDAPKVSTTKSFELTQSPLSDVYVMVHPLNTTAKAKSRPKLQGIDLSTEKDAAANEAKKTIFLKISYPNGVIDQYMCKEMDEFTPDMYMAIPKGSLVGRVLTVNYEGTTLTYELPVSEKMTYMNNRMPFEALLIDTTGVILDDNTVLQRDQNSNKTSQWGVGQKWQVDVAFQVGFLWSFPYDDMDFCDASHISLRLMRNFRKWYSLGMSMELGFYQYDYNSDGAANLWDQTVNANTTGMLNINLEDRVVSCTDWNMELFQRIRLMSGGLMHKGLYWDLGIYGGMKWGRYSLVYNEDYTANSGREEHTWYNVRPTGYSSLWKWGLTTRVTYDIFGVYARYRMSQSSLDLPRLELGLELSF